MLTVARLSPCERRPLTISPSPALLSRRSRGQRVTTVRRIAKRVVLELASGDAFVIEPRMTGLMLLSDPPTKEHLRFEWRFQGRGPRSLWFWDQRGLGTIRLFTAAELKQLESGGALGRDALAMTINDWIAVLGRRKKPVKVALLDQSLVAGIGNLYASEILHLAGIHPELRTDRLTAPQFKRLHEATQTVLLTAIEYEGSTLGDGTYRNALNESGSYQNAHRVYAREEETCPTCGKGVIVRIVQAQRSTFYCEVCQPRTRARSVRPPGRIPVAALRRTSR